MTAPPAEPPKPAVEEDPFESEFGKREPVSMPGIGQKNESFEEIKKDGIDTSAGSSATQDTSKGAPASEMP